MALNNLQLSHEYTLRFTDNVGRESLLRFPHDRAKLESCLAMLSEAAEQFERLLNWGVARLSSDDIAPRVGTLADALLASSYELTEDDLASFDVGSNFMTSLISGLRLILLEFQSTLTSATTELLIPVVAGSIAENLERVVLQCRFNRLGGIQFEKDIRALITYLSANTPWSVRDKFVRLSQIATLLNLEKVR